MVLSNVIDMNIDMKYQVTVQTRIHPSYCIYVHLLTHLAKKYDTLNDIRDQQSNTNHMN